MEAILRDNNPNLAICFVGDLVWACGSLHTEVANKRVTLKSSPADLL
jgi:hypothetical protein